MWCKSGALTHKQHTWLPLWGALLTGWIHTMYPPQDVGAHTEAVDG